MSVDESQQPAHPTRRKGGRRWCGNGCACWPTRGVDPNQLEKALPEQGVSLRSLVARTRKQLAMRAKANMTSRMRSKRAMSGCLACKACSTQCPIKIDVPEFRSRFPAAVPQPLSAAGGAIIWWASVESYAPLMAQAPKTF